MFKLLYILIYNQFKPPFTTYNYFYAFIKRPNINDCSFRQVIYSKNVFPQSLEKLIRVNFVLVGFQKKVTFYSDISLLKIQVKIPIYV